jgi:hypothetical protein
MPINNPGYDFKCVNNHFIDVKSSCKNTSRKTSQWSFTIDYNTIADFFLCIAFDNRDDLNPQHLWMIPGNVVSHRKAVSVSESTLDKWKEYEKPISEAINCCNTLRGDVMI